MLQTMVKTRPDGSFFFVRSFLLLVGINKGKVLKTKKDVSRHPNLFT